LPPRSGWGSGWLGGLGRARPSGRSGSPSWVNSFQGPSADNRFAFGFLHGGVGRHSTTAPPGRALLFAALLDRIGQAGTKLNVLALPAEVRSGRHQHSANVVGLESMIEHNPSKAATRDSTHRREA
jgi:hypothetical protein